jgi:hypothetical protein
MTEKCTICGRSIKGNYTWKSEYYGKECWKKHALPELLAQQEKEDAENAEYEYLQAKCLIDVFRTKNLSRITNQFKLDFIPSIISQFDEKGFLTWKQNNIAYDILSNSDYDKLYILEYRSDLISIEYCEQMTGFTQEEIKAYNKI